MNRFSGFDHTLWNPNGIRILVKRHGNRQTQREFPVIAEHFVHSVSTVALTEDVPESV